MTLNDFVDKIYCINLDRRPDRWARCEDIFRTHNLSVKRVPAVDGKTLSGGTLPLGALGVLRSNLSVFEGARDAGLSKICIFEDDIELDDDFNDKFSEYISCVPADWSFIYLGGSNKKPSVPICCHIKKMTKTYGAYAMIIRNNIFNEIIEELKKENLQCDLVYANMHSKHPSYIVDPFLAWVRNDYSDINGRFINVSRLRRE